MRQFACCYFRLTKTYPTCGPRRGQGGLGVLLTATSAVAGSTNAWCALFNRKTVNVQETCTIPCLRHRRWEHTGDVGDQPERHKVSGEGRGGWIGSGRTSPSATRGCRLLIGTIRQCRGAARPRHCQQMHSGEVWRPPRLPAQRQPLSLTTPCSGSGAQEDARQLSNRRRRLPIQVATVGDADVANRAKNADVTGGERPSTVNTAVGRDASAPAAEHPQEVGCHWPRTPHR